METFPKEKKHDFNLEIVLKAFTKCHREDDTLGLEDYLSAYHELCRFFKLTGHLFGFVARDLESKIKGVENHIHSSYGKNYHTVQSMVAYEIKNGTTHTKGHHPSGCRMFLRLHRALEFILSFMRRIMNGDEHEKMPKLAWEVYSETLYHHHPWLTRKLAAVAVYALPTKKHLIDAMCRHEYKKVMDLLQQVVDVGQPVYDISQNVFAKHSLLNIP